MGERKLGKYDIVSRATGRWAGAELIVTDPSSGQVLKAGGRLSVTECLGGAGFTSVYAQEVDGMTTMHCVTVYSFAEDGGATASWSPSIGGAQIFTGSVDGPVCIVRRTDEDGLQHVLTTDYSDPGRMLTSMTIGPPGVDGAVVFEGAYTKQGPLPGHAVWRDLSVDDADTRKAFYESVLGWRATPVDMGGYDDFHMGDAAGEVVAGICHARGVNAKSPPTWLVYFAVPSLEAALAAAVDGGGRVISGPNSFANYNYAVLADPAGAEFVACEETFN